MQIRQFKKFSGMLVSWRRCVCVFLVAALFLQATFQAEAFTVIQDNLSGIATSSQFQNKIQFPKIVKSSWIQKSKRQVPQSVVYLIQDAHTSLIAQQKITQTLESLRRQKALDAVLVEGASGSLTDERFRERPDLKRDAALIETLERQGYLHGAAAFYLNSPEILATGLESASLYRSNFESFRRVYRFQEPIRFAGERLRVEWQRWVKAHVPVKDQAFFLNSMSVSRPSIDPAYFESLIQMATDELGLNWGIRDQSEWPNLIRIQRLFEIQPRLRVKEARQAFKKLQKMLPGSWQNDWEKIQIQKDNETAGQTMNGNAGELRDFAARLMQELLRKRIPLIPYQPFFDWLAVTTLQSEIEAEGLMDETEKLEDLIWKKWFQKPEDRRQMALGRLSALLDKASRLELTRREVKKFRRAAQTGEFAFWFSKLAPEQKKYLRKFIEAVTLFYATAEKRDSVFSEKIADTLAVLNLQKIKVPHVAIVVGGYHKDGLVEALRSKNLDLALISPKLERIDQDVNYLERMLQPAVETSTLAMVPSAVLGRGELRALVGASVAAEEEAGLQIILERSESRLLTPAPTIRRSFLTRFIPALIGAPWTVKAAAGETVEAMMAELGKLNQVVAGAPSAPASDLPELIPTVPVTTQPFDWQASVFGKEYLEVMLRKTPEARRAAIAGLLQREMRRQYFSIGTTIAVPGGESIKVTDIFETKDFSVRFDAPYRTLEAAGGLLDALLSVGPRAAADEAYVKLLELEWQLQVRLLAVQFYDKVVAAQSNLAEQTWISTTLPLLKKYKVAAENRKRMDPKLIFDGAVTRLQTSIKKLEIQSATLQRQSEILTKEISYLTGIPESALTPAIIQNIPMAIPSVGLTEVSERERLKSEIKKRIQRHLAFQIHDARGEAAKYTRNAENRKGWLSILIPFTGPAKPKVNGPEVRGWTPGRREANLELEDAHESMRQVVHQLEVEALIQFSDLWTTLDKIQQIEDEVASYQKDWREGAWGSNAFDQKQLDHFDAMDQLGRDLIALREKASQLQHRLVVAGFMDAKDVRAAPAAVRPVIFKSSRSEQRNQGSFFARVRTSMMIFMTAIFLWTGFSASAAQVTQETAHAVTTAVQKDPSVLFSGKVKPASLGEGASAGASGGVLVQALRSGVVTNEGQGLVLRDPVLEDKIKSVITELTPLLKEEEGARNHPASWSPAEKLGLDLKVANLKIQLALLMQLRMDVSLQGLPGKVLADAGSAVQSAWKEVLPQGFVALNVSVPSAQLEATQLSLTVNGVPALIWGGIHELSRDPGAGVSVVRFLVQLPKDVSSNDAEYDVKLFAESTGKVLHQNTPVLLKINEFQIWTTAQRLTQTPKAQSAGKYRGLTDGVRSGKVVISPQWPEPQSSQIDWKDSLVVAQKAVLSAEKMIGEARVKKGAEEEIRVLESRLAELNQTLASLRSQRIYAGEKPVHFSVNPVLALGLPVEEGAKLGNFVSEQVVVGKNGEVMVPKSVNISKNQKVVITRGGQKYSAVVTAVNALPDSSPDAAKYELLVIGAFSAPLPQGPMVFFDSEISPWESALAESYTENSSSVATGRVDSLIRNPDPKQQLEMFQSLKANLSDAEWQKILEQGNSELVFHSARYLMTEKGDWGLMSESLRKTQGTSVFNRSMSAAIEAVMSVLQNEGDASLNEWKNRLSGNLEGEIFAVRMALEIIEKDGIHSSAAQKILNSNFLTLEEWQATAEGLGQSKESREQSLARQILAWVNSALAEEQIASLKYTREITGATSGRDMKTPLLNLSPEKKRSFVHEGQARSSDETMLTTGHIGGSLDLGMDLIDPETARELRKAGNGKSGIVAKVAMLNVAWKSDREIFQSWSLMNFDERMAAVSEYAEQGRFYELSRVLRIFADEDTKLGSEIQRRLFKTTSGRLQFLAMVSKVDGAAREKWMKILGESSVRKIAEDANFLVQESLRGDVSPEDRSARFYYSQFLAEAVRVNASPKQNEILMQTLVGLIPHDYALQALIDWKPGVSADTDFVIQALGANKTGVMASAAREMNLRALSHAITVVSELELFRAKGERRLGGMENSLEQVRKKLADARLQRGLPSDLKGLLSWAHVPEALSATLAQEAEAILKNWKTGERPHFDPVRDYHFGAGFFSYLLLGLSAFAAIVISWGVRNMGRHLRRERKLDQLVRSGVPIHRMDTLPKWRAAFDTLVASGGYSGRYEPLKELIEEWAGLLKINALSPATLTRILEIENQIKNDQWLWIKAGNFINFRWDDNKDRRDRMHDIIDLVILTQERVAQASLSDKEKAAFNELESFVLWLMNAKNILILLQNLKENHGYQAILLFKTGIREIDNEAERMYQADRRAWGVIRWTYRLKEAEQKHLIAVILKRVAAYVEISKRFQVSSPSLTQAMDELNDAAQNELNGNAFIKPQTHRSTNNNSSAANPRKQFSRLAGISMLGMAVVSVISLAAMIFHFGLLSWYTLTFILGNVGAFAGLFNYIAHLRTNVSGHTERHFDEVMLQVIKLRRVVDAQTMQRPALASLVTNRVSAAQKPAFRKAISVPVAAKLSAAPQPSSALKPAVSKPPKKQLFNFEPIQKELALQLAGKQDPGITQLIVAINGQDDAKKAERVFGVMLERYGYKNLPIYILKVPGVSAGNGLPALAVNRTVSQATKAWQAKGVKNPKILVLKAFGPDTDFMRVATGSTAFTPSTLRDERSIPAPIGAVKIAQAALAFKKYRNSDQPVALVAETDTLHDHGLNLSVLSATKPEVDVTFFTVAKPISDAYRFGVPVLESDRDGSQRIAGFFEKARTAENLASLINKFISGKNVSVGTNSVPESEVAAFIGEIAIHASSPDKQEKLEKLFKLATEEFKEAADANPELDFDAMLDFWSLVIRAASDRRGRKTPIQRAQSLATYTIYRAGVNSKGNAVEASVFGKRQSAFIELHNKIYEAAYSANITVQAEHSAQSGHFDIRDLSDYVKVLLSTSTTPAETSEHFRVLPEKGIVILGPNGTFPRVTRARNLFAGLAYTEDGKPMLVHGPLTKTPNTGLNRLGVPDISGDRLARIVDEDGRAFLTGLQPGERPLFMPEKAEPPKPDADFLDALYGIENVSLVVRGGVETLKRRGYVAAGAIHTSLIGVEHPAYEPARRAGSGKRAELRGFVGLVRTGALDAALIIFQGVLRQESKAYANRLAVYAPSILKGVYAADRDVMILQSPAPLTAVPSQEVLAQNTLYVDGTIFNREILENIETLRNAPFKINVLFTQKNKAGFERLRLVLGGKTQAGSLSIRLGAKVEEMIIQDVRANVQANPIRKMDYAFAGADKAVTRRLRPFVGNLLTADSQVLPAQLLLDAFINPAIFNLGVLNPRVWTLENALPYLLQDWAAIALTRTAA